MAEYLLVIIIIIIMIITKNNNNNNEKNVKVLASKLGRTKGGH